MGGKTRRVELLDTTTEIRIQGVREGCKSYGTECKETGVGVSKGRGDPGMGDSGVDGTRE